MSDILACVPDNMPVPYTDNVTGKCAKCGCGIQYRPSAPEHFIKMCMMCVLGEDAQLGPAEHAILPQAKTELMARGVTEEEIEGFLHQLNKEGLSS